MQNVEALKDHFFLEIFQIFQQSALMQRTDAPMTGTELDFLGRSLGPFYNLGETVHPFLAASELAVPAHM